MLKSALIALSLSGVMLIAATAAHAKCTVTLKFTNNDTHEITVLGNDSQARVNGLTWSKMNFNDVTVQPGATGNATSTTNMSCGGTPNAICGSSIGRWKQVPEDGQQRGHRGRPDLQVRDQERLRSREGLVAAPRPG